VRRLRKKIRQFAVIDFPLPLSPRLQQLSPPVLEGSRKLPDEAACFLRENTVL
jgi:hypothetical protein